MIIITEEVDGCDFNISLIYSASLLLLISFFKIGPIILILVYLVVEGLVLEGFVAHQAAVVVVGLVVGTVEGFSVHQIIGVLGLLVGLAVVEKVVDHHELHVVGLEVEKGSFVHQGLVVGLLLVGFVLVHQEDVVVFFVVHSPCICSVELAAPESTPVVVSGGAGVDGVGGLVQSPLVGFSEIRPNS